MKKLTYILIWSLPLLLVGCYNDNVDLVDFTSTDGGVGAFRVISQKTTDLGNIQWSEAQQELFAQSSMQQNLDDSVQAPMRASSTNMNAVVQQLIDWGHGQKAIELAGVYLSEDTKKNPIMLSGKVILPANKKFKRYILVSHYTIAANEEAPSQTFSLEAMLVSLGYALIIPDYLGYGVTADKVHPYLVMETTTTNVLDMYFQVLPFMEAAGLAPEHDDIYLMGYSQGGAVTMGVQHLIETRFTDQVKIRRVFAGGGPYDVKATYDKFIETNYASYPCAVPLMTQGVVVGNNLNLDLATILQLRIYENLDEWINTKKYTTTQINELIDTHITDELLTSVGMDRTSHEVSELYKALTLNSILSYSWTPEAPVFIFHSIDDDIVPYVNATLAKSKWQYGNIQYNFGHYGNHVAGLLRFIMNVRTLLINEEKEENGNYNF
ncbi:MAG: lipase family protein [Paludibacteraceae bacterium]